MSGATEYERWMLERWDREAAADDIPECYVCGEPVGQDEGWHRDGKAWCAEHQPVWSRP